jgi:predicted nucleic acid-binding protein
VEVKPRYLADKSALARLRYPPVRAVLEPLILAGDVATCGVIELEILYSARGFEDLVNTRQIRTRAFQSIDTVQVDFDRAAEVMTLLAQRGLHRSVGIPDLLIAALAERQALTLIHYDVDYENVAGVTGQPMQWVVPRGSVP